jgi:Uma2 family endonuclease
MSTTTKFLPIEISIRNPALLRRLIRKRRESGADRWDEVWDGVYIMAPPPNDEHQDVLGMLYFAFQASIGLTRSGIVRFGVNITDRADDWRRNFRTPDVAVFLPGNPAINKKSHWLGGPDFAVEVISPYDRTREKLAFYAKIGVRELLIVDRYPWALELYRLDQGTLTLVGTSTVDKPDLLASAVLPLSFQLVDGDPRPTIEVTHSDGVQRWSA